MILTCLSCLMFPSPFRGRASRLIHSAFLDDCDNARVAEQLLARKANPLVRCKSGWTPLHAAACSGSVDTAAVLLAAISKGDVDVRGPNNQTPLHRASFWGQVGTVRMLLSAGADRTLADAGGYMPLHLVCDGGHQRREIPKLQKMLKSPPPALR